MSGRGLPTGTVTFLFTDIEGSTKLLQQLRDEFPIVLADQRDLLRAAFQRWNGHEVDTQGDAFFVAFPRALDAVSAAVEAQVSLASHAWPQGVSVRIRMGLHTGEPTLTGTGYVGIDVHRAARMCAVGHGGQVLLSRSTYDLVEGGLPVGASIRDLGEHRLKDLQRPERVFQLVIQDLPHHFPPLKSLDSLPNNLPIQLTSFVGREQEMAAVKRLLLTTRLLTLTGVGGTGKTRLALQVAADLLDSYTDGVWLVELASLSDPALVPQTVAITLGVREEGGRPILTTLSDYLRGKKMLLVFDNCEHLIETCAIMADALLHSCPHLKVLATSREVLGIAGEMTWSVPSLSLPVARQMATSEDLAQYEAVRLFVDRAKYASPGFKLTNQNAQVVAQVCQQLDGIPLAIELAAARVKVLSVEQISRRLNDRFRLLVGGSRTALPRQQTLRALVDWSHDLLSDAERVLFRRLSVFSGGCTLEAIEAVCGEYEDPETRRQEDTEKAPIAASPSPRVGVSQVDVLDLLTHLVDKSLVLVERQNAEARYHMLETIRQYAGHKLEESREAERIHARHLDFFVVLGEQGELRIKSAERPAWTNRLEIENDNLRTALAWAIKGDVEKGLRLAGALFRFWLVRGYISEGRQWLDKVLVASLGAPGVFRAKALIGAGALALWQRDFAAGHALLEESLALCGEIGDRRGLAHALRWLETEASWRGDLSTAEDLGEKSVALFREVEEKWDLAESLGWHGWVAMQRGDYATAHTRLDESHTLFGQSSDMWSVAFPLHGLGQIAYRQGDYVTARALCEESLALFREAGDTNGCAILTATLGEIARIQGDFEQAASYYKDSLALRSSEMESSNAWLHANLGYVAQHQGDRANAIMLFEKSLAVARKIGEKELIGVCLIGFAAAAEARRQPELAALLLASSATLLESIGAQLDPTDHAESEHLLATVRTQLGEDKFAKAWAEGRALTMEEAIELATSDVT